MAFTEKVLTRLRAMEKDLNDGRMHKSMARKVHRVSGSQWAEYNRNHTGNSSSPKIHVHDLNNTSPEDNEPRDSRGRRVGARASTKHWINKTTNTKCVVILTDTDNLNSVVEGLLR